MFLCNLLKKRQTNLSKTFYKLKHKYSVIMENKTLHKLFRGILPVVLCLIAFISGNINAQHTDTARNTQCALWSSFSFSVDGLHVKFAGTSNGEYYSWDFGDNTTALGEHQSHTFANEGSYPVCLTTYNKYRNCSVKVCTKVIVKKPCTLRADFEFSTDGLGFKARANTSEKAQILWDLGDGTRTSGESAGHYYKQAGVYVVCIKAFSADGRCSTSACKKVVIRKPCALAADFEFSTDGLGFKARAKASETAKIVWDFGDGNSSAGETVSHYFSKAGVYAVCIKAYSEDGRCSTSVCKKIEVKKPVCTLKVDASYRIDCSSGKVQFIAHTISNNSLVFNWKFSNGTSATGPNPTAEFKPGIYQVCVEVHDANRRCSGHYCFSITVCKCPSEPCDLRPDFKFRVDCSQNVVYFSASANGAERFGWDFGDGSSADGDFVRHQYRGDGVYEVCLKVADKDGNCTKRICKKVVIDCDTCELNPKFEYRIDCEDKAVKFRAASNGGEYYYWSFGDGSHGEGMELRHNFRHNGVYLVCLTVKDKEGRCKEQICERIKIECDPCDLQPEFGFRTDCQLGVTYFKATSNGGEHYVWSFGDGTSARGRETKHPYSEDGTYEVCLKVYDKDERCVETVCRKVVIDCDPCGLNPEFRYNVSCPDRIIRVNGTSANGYTYYWSFGDGSHARGAEMKHQYKEDGVYLVCLTVVDRKGQCKEQTCKRVKVDCDPCDLDPQFGYRLDCSSRTIYLKGSSNNGSLYYWSFGDGSSATGAETKHTYSRDGIYLVTLTVKDANERCKESVAMKILIDCSDCDVKAGFRHEVHYDFDMNTKSRYAIVDFKNISENAASYKWDFGDGGSSDQEHVRHIYRKAGIYKVCLTAIDRDGKCRNVFCTEIKIGFDQTQIGGIKDIRRVMKLYPNPSNGQFIIDCGGIDDVDVRVKDLSGKTAFTAKVRDGSTIDLSKLANGSYFIEATTSSNELLIEKLVLIK